MKPPIFDILAKAGIELKPGQIYWFRSPQSSTDALRASDLEKYIHHWSDQWINGVYYQVIEKIAPTPELVDTVVARRFNLGSLGKYNLLVDKFSNILSFLSELSDVSSLDDTEVVDLSRRVLRESRFDLPRVFPSTSHSLLEESATMEDRYSKDSRDMSESEPSFECYSLRSRRDRDKEEVCKDFESEPGPQEEVIHFMAVPSLLPKKDSKRTQAKRVKPDAEEAKDKQEVETLEKAKDELVKRITAIIVDYVNTTHQMPPMEEINALVKGKIVLTPTGLSRMVVNDQLKIYLPDYNELEIAFRPLPLTIYILFLRHLEGIVLNYIGDYTRELEEIYSIVMPNRDEKSAIKSIKSLTDTLTGSLNQKIAIIKRTFKANILNEEMAAKYYISGSRGDAYKVTLPKELIQLPAVFD